MNNEILEDIPQPDPAWDYYIEWHKLIKVRSQVNKLIEFLSKVENATEDTQEILQNHITAITDTLESI